MGIGTLDAILEFIVCYNEKEKLVEWQRECVSCFIAELVEQLSGMWHLFVPHLLVHDVTPPSQEGSESITFISQ